MHTNALPLDVPRAIRSFDERLRQLLALYEPVGGVTLTVEVSPGPGRLPPPPAHFGYARIEGFGDLSWDHGWWKGSLDIPGWGGPVEVTFGPIEDAPSPLPTSAQLEAVRQFAATGEEIRRRVDTASLEYYRQLRAEYLAARYRERRDPFSEVDEPSDLWRLLSNLSLHVPEQTPDGWAVEICWECHWDPEHGHQVTVRDGEVTGIGSQG
jgi:hypothetical protein